MTKVQLHIAAQIALRREALGMSRQRLAELAELLPGDVDRIESGERNVSPAELLRIAAALQVSPAVLFGDQRTGEPRRRGETTGFSEGPAGFAQPEEIVRLISAFDAIAEPGDRMCVIEFAETVSKSSLN
jgi:transcriptional regulator with XRE-family HTH domain